MTKEQLVESIKAKFPAVEVELPAPPSAPAPAPAPAAPGAAPAKPAPATVPAEFQIATVVAPLDQFRALMEWLHGDPALALDFPMSQTAVDQPEKKKLVSVYHLFSMRHHHKLVVKVELDRENPSIPTVSDLYRGCEWFERETYDFFGIRFENHPDLRRIMLTDDWVGWPLRKDYQDSRMVPKPNY